MDFAPAKSRRGVIINVTSLIDVMFLLLIFFLVSSTFTNQPAIKLVLPRSATAEQTAVTPSIVYLTETGRLFLNDREYTRDELGAVLAQLQAGTAEDRIVLRADENAPHGEVVSLIDLIKESGFTRVSLAARTPGGR